MKKNRLGLIVSALFLVLFIITPASLAHSATKASGTSVASLSGVYSMFNASPVTPAALSAEINQINQLNSVILTKSSGTTTDTARLKNTANIRKPLVLKLMKDKPLAFLALKIPETSLSTLPQDVRSNVEKTATLEGTMDVLAINSFNHGATARNVYYLNSGGERLQFFPAGKMPAITSGTKVKINGVKLDNEVVASIDRSNFQIMGNIPPPESVGDQKTLIMLIDYPDSASKRPSPEEIRNLIFNGQFQNFYREESYNKVSFSGDVYGWYTCQHEDEMCFDNLIQQNHIDLNQYGRLIEFHDLPSDTPIWGVGATVGKSGIVVNGKTYPLSDTYVFAPTDVYTQPSAWGEMPFPWTNLDFMTTWGMNANLGVFAPNGWDCHDQALYGNCDVVYGGNQFDIGSTGFSSLHSNAYYKELLGWVSPSEENLITASGNYSIGPIELASSSKKLAKIQMQGSDQTPFYLEYRKAVGFDANLARADLASNQNGLMINKTHRDIWGDASSELIDSSPTALDWFDDAKQATLNGTTTPLVDSGRGITVGPVLGNNSAGINFNVHVGTPICERHEPSVYNDLLGGDPQTGGWGSLSFNFKNEDSVGCPPSNFSVTANLPKDWQFFPPTPLPNNYLYPEDEGQYYFQFYVPENALPGEYPISFIVHNDNSGSQTVTNRIVIVTQAPYISSLAPTIAAPLISVKITGNAFSGLANPYVYIFGPLNSEQGLYSNTPINIKSNTQADFIFPASMNVGGCENCMAAPSTGNYMVIIFADNHVSNPAIITILASSTAIRIQSPKGGETWPGTPQLTDTLSGYYQYAKDVTWTGSPDYFDPTIVAAYLEKKDKDVYVTVGRIVPLDYGSIMWVVGEVSKPTCDLVYPSNTPNSCYNIANMQLVPPGEYYIRLVDSATHTTDRSHAFSITGPVPTRPVITVTTSTLTLGISPKTGESQLQAQFAGTVTTGPSDLNLSNHPFGADLRLNGKQTNGSNDNRLTYTFDKSLVNNTIPAHSTVGYTVTLTDNPQKLFGGSYTASLGYLYDVNGGVFAVNSNETNALTIVGEVSPYINSITSPVNAGEAITATGVRLNNISSGILDNTPFNPCAIITCTVSSDGTIFSFTLSSSTAPGWHWLQLRDSTTGLSNFISFMVTGSKSSVIPDPTGKAAPGTSKSADLSANVIDSLNNLVNMAKVNSMTAEIRNSINLLLKNLKVFGGN